MRSDRTARRRPGKSAETGTSKPQAAAWLLPAVAIIALMAVILAILIGLTSSTTIVCSPAGCSQAPFMAVLAERAAWLVSIVAICFVIALASRRTRRREHAPALSMPTSPEATSQTSSDGQWLKVVGESVGMFGELADRRGEFSSRERDLAEHVMHRIEESLERSGVEVIRHDGGAFDRLRHQPERGVNADPGFAISQTVTPGFAVGPRVFRRAEVKLAQPAKGTK